MNGFRGHNQTIGSSERKGPISQRELLDILRVLIDTSRGKAASRTRDDARRTLREVMAVANWNTSYVLRNLGAKRCRYLSGLDYPVSSDYSMRTSIDRLAEWERRNG